MNVRLKWYEVPCDCHLSTSNVKGMHHSTDCALMIAWREETERWACRTPGNWRDRDAHDVALCSRRPCHCNIVYAQEQETA